MPQYSRPGSIGREHHQRSKRSRDDPPPRLPPRGGNRSGAATPHPKGGAVAGDPIGINGKEVANVEFFKIPLHLEEDSQKLGEEYARGYLEVLRRTDCNISNPSDSDGDKEEEEDDDVGKAADQKAVHSEEKKKARKKKLFSGTTLYHLQQAESGTSGSVNLKTTTSKTTIAAVAPPESPHFRPAGSFAPKVTGLSGGVILPPVKGPMTGMGDSSSDDDDYDGDEERPRHTGPLRVAERIVRGGDHQDGNNSDNVENSDEEAAYGATSEGEGDVSSGSRGEQHQEDEAEGIAEADNEGVDDGNTEQASGGGENVIQQGHNDSYSADDDDASVEFFEDVTAIEGAEQASSVESRRGLDAAAVDRGIDEGIDEEEEPFDGEVEEV